MVLGFACSRPVTRRHLSGGDLLRRSQVFGFASDLPCAVNHDKSAAKLTSTVCALYVNLTLRSDFRMARH